MQVSVVAALMIVTTILLSACEQKQVAQVEDRSSQYYGRAAVGQAVAGYSAATYQAASLDSISSGDVQAPASMASSAAYGARPAGTPFGGPTPAPGATVAESSFTASQPVFTASMAKGWDWPVQGNVVETFGKQAEGIANEGITIAAAEGTPIRAAGAGEVAYVGSNVRDYGNMVIVRHPGGELTSYAHAKEIRVAKGAKVAQGEVLGYVGQTGNAKTPQLHFAMREGNRAIDPMSKLPSHMASR